MALYSAARAFISFLRVSCMLPKHQSELQTTMHIWVDADACPGVIKDILFRAAERTQIMMTLVANNGLRMPRSPYIRMLQVPRGFDVADNEIAKQIGRASCRARG